MKNWVLKQLLRIHERALLTPYYNLEGYMLRDWILGYRSPERNKGNPHWVQQPSSALYRFICRHLAIRAHTILRSDGERHMHDHPSWSISIVLEGGYWEVLGPTRYAQEHDLVYPLIVGNLERGGFDPENSGDKEHLAQFGIHWRGPGAVVFRRAKTFHKLVLPRRTITRSIFVLGKRTNSWGFKTENGKVYWRDYLDM